MPTLPDFEGLAMFAKVVEERSYAGAARSMGVSVATVSRAVARLEDRLGGRLFNRSSRRLGLTDFGHRLADRAARLYIEAEEIEHVALEAARRPRGLVRLAAPMSFGTRWVAPILPDFFRHYPDIAVDLHLSDEQVDLIVGGFDAALRIAVLEELLSGRQATGPRPALHRRSAVLSRALWPSPSSRRPRGPSLSGLCLPGQARCLAVYEQRGRRCDSHAGGAVAGYQC